MRSATALLALCVFSFSASAHADSLTVRIATIAPEGTGWAREFNAWARDLNANLHGAVHVKLLLPSTGDSSVHKGELAPILGWASRGFDRREPTNTVVWRAHLSVNTVLRTELRF